MHKTAGRDSLTDFENSLNEALDEDIAGPGEEDEDDEAEEEGDLDGPDDGD